FLLLLLPQPLRDPRGLPISMSPVDVPLAQKHTDDRQHDPGEDQVTPPRHGRTALNLRVASWLLRARARTTHNCTPAIHRSNSPSSTSAANSSSSTRPAS